jgi:hypothetical protein
MIRITKDVMLQVKEMMERKWDCVEIASRLNLDVDDVRIIIDLVNNIFT